MRQEHKAGEKMFVTTRASVEVFYEEPEARSQA